MFKKLLELRQQKAQIETEMRSILEKADSEKRSTTEAEGSKFDELRSQADGLAKEIARYEVITDEQRNQAGQQVENSKMTVGNDELRHWIKTGELRSLATNTNGGADGGYSVIPQLDKDVMKRLADDSVMRQIANVVRLPVGAREYKKLVSAGGAVVNHIGEGETRTETATPKMNEVTISLHNIYAYPKTTQEILDFGGVDILSWLTDEITESFAETEETDLTNGTGTKQAKGFLAYPRTTANDKTRPFGTLQKMEVVPSKLNADALIDLLYSLHSKYRKNAVWVMNSQTAGTLQKLKNGNGDYIWRDGLQVGAPSTLLGLPVYYVETIPNAEGTNPFLAVGDFKRGYTIVDHETGTRTKPDAITEPGFYKIHTDKYLGGGVVDSNAIKVLEAKAS
ncbi:phage major capsid protein [Glaesserella parasuis]|uniref:phage major capsid protein n=1 Tax=Glaesserella parasuis TaxID=738 RepID=UPI00271B0171|nr:phage major capsid protein [Glaesserella parasuis]MDP0025758.1 phage major capsid protein [Glaesserella parasuis]MDP0242209.1 phage major capsid protein [Glaesserella parasuis]MEE3690295.1 phage major capsid protein [Glaesserella parasuis]